MSLMYKESFGEIVRKSIHPVIVRAFKLMRKHTLNVVGTIPKDGPHIYVINHYCIQDIPIAGEVIHKHIYLLVSSISKGSIDGLEASINGVVWTNRLDKADRRRAHDDLIRHLKLGHSILICPEATWNLSPNLPVLPMNYGCVTISQETNVPIVPIYLYFTKGHCDVEINEPYIPCQDKVQAIAEIRDIMATSAWKFMESHGMMSRDSFPDDYWEADIAERYSQYSRARKDPEGVREYEKQFIFRMKDYVTAEEAFAHLKTLNPNLNNAFLLRNV